MTFTPRPSQLHDLAVLRANNYTGLLNIQTGYGKTIVSCMAAKEAGAKTVLVVAPESTHKSAWGEDVALVLPGVKPRLIGNSNKEQKKALSDLEWGVEGWYICTPQFFARKSTDISQWYVDMMIADEIHLLTTPGSAGQRKLSGFSNEDDPIVHRAKHRLGLSATPARNKFENLWGAMRFLWPELSKSGQVAYSNPWNWKAQRMTQVRIKTNQLDRWGQRKVATKWLLEREPGKLFSEAPCVIQHFKREHCCDFHPPREGAPNGGFLDVEEPQKIVRDVILSAEQRKIIRDLEKQSLAWLEEHPLVVEMPVTLHQRLRQVALGVPKIEYVPSEDPDEVPKAVVTFDPECKSPVVEEIIAEAEKLDGEPVVIFVESQKFVEVLAHRLTEAGIPAKEYSGKRKADLKGFGKDYQAIVGQLTAIGTGTDGLQHITNTEFWVQRSLDETINEQAEGRADRSGQKRQVQRVYFQDDLGMFKGQLSEAITKRLTLNRSLRKAAR
jgi:hypothetical protein